MTETERPSPARDDWELIELFERREDFEKLLAVSRRAARLNPKLKKDFQAVIEERRLYEILKVERGPGKVRLTLANLWRLSRYENRPGLFPEAFDPAAVTLQAFDLADGDWKEEARDEINWKFIQNPWIFGRPLLECMDAAPFIWPDLRLEDPTEIYNPSYFSLLAALALKIFHALGSELKHDYCVDVFAESLSARFFKLPYKEPSRVIDAALGRYILDEEVLSLVRPMDVGYGRHLSHYLKARAQRIHLARLVRETPNFLPVLNLIPCAWWARRDLLRDKVLRFAHPAFQYVSAAGLRWLRRAPMEALRRLCLEYGRLYKEIAYIWTRLVIEVMAELSPWPGEAFWESCQATVIDRTMTLGFWLGHSFKKVDLDPVSARRLVRTLARHILNLAAENRRQRHDATIFFVAVHEIEIEISHLADWYKAEGCRQGLPDKNSTWVSLTRRADKWHQEIWRRKMAEAENSAWESLLGPMEIGGIKVQPLVTGLDLYNEGREMKHCVVSYAPRCANEGRRIFSLTEPDGRRSTLSLRPRAKGYAIDQHKGPANGPVSPAAARAAREICRLYTRQHKAAAKAAPL